MPREYCFTHQLWHSNGCDQCQIAERDRFRRALKRIRNAYPGDDPAKVAKAALEGANP